MKGRLYHMLVVLSQHLLFSFILFSVQLLVWGITGSLRGSLSSTQCSGSRGPVGIWTSGSGSIDPIRLSTELCCRLGGTFLTKHLA